MPIIVVIVSVSAPVIVKPSVKRIVKRLVVALARFHKLVFVILKLFAEFVNQSNYDNAN